MQVTQPTTTEDTMTQYQQAYEDALREALADWAHSHIGDGKAARAEAVARLQEGGGWGSEGVYGYYAGHHSEDVIAAEVRSRAAALIEAGLAHMATALPGDNDKVRTPSDLLAAVRKQLQRDVEAGLTGGRSTNPWHNLVVQEIGRHTYKLLDESYGSSLASLAWRADSKARWAVAGEEMAAAQARRDQVRELQGMIQRARSEGRKAELQDELGERISQVAEAELQVRAALAVAGAPQEVLAA